MRLRVYDRPEKARSRGRGLCEIQEPDYTLEDSAGDRFQEDGQDLNGRGEMPTLLRVGPYRLFIYSADCQEPPHVHVERDDKVAKFWLEPVRLQQSGGFRRNEINRINRVIDEHWEALLRGWNERCRD